MAKKTKDSNLSIEERLEQALIPNWDEPYKLPENWCWVNLGSLGSLGMGQTILSKDLKEEGIPVYSATEENKIFGYISESENTTKLCSGDIVIPARGNSIGHVKYVSCNEASCTQTTMFFKPFDKAIGKYVYYYMLGNKHKLFAYHGNAIPQITITNIIKKEIPLPPLEEQLRMVERIEILFDKLDEAKEKAQAVVDGFETRKAAILHKAFSGELTAKWRKSQDIVQTWSYVQLQQITVKIGDGLHGTPTYTQNTDYYFINGNNLSGHSIEIKPDTKTVDRTEYEKNYIELDDQTVLLSINGTLGNTAFYAGEKVILGKSACYITVQKGVLDKCYLRYYLTSKEFYNFAHANATGSTIKNLGLKQIRQHKIPLPSIEEQREIVSILNSIITRENGAKESAEAVIEQIDTMKKAILARTFRGELGTNDPSEESAVELLKQVLSTATEPNKSVAKRTIIPNSLESRIKTDLERKIVKLYIQNEVDVLSIDLIMGVSSKKFEIMETLRNLQQRCLLEKQNDKYKLLG